MGQVAYLLAFFALVFAVLGGLLTDQKWTKLIALAVGCLALLHLLAGPGRI